MLFLSGGCDHLLTGLPNSPMAGVRIRVGSGNFVIAKPLGVIDGTDYRLPVKLLPSLPRGVAGLPVGLPGLAAIVRSAGWVQISS